VLSRSYWLRGPTPLAEILDMLAEGRDLARKLGDIEIVAEAFQWRIAALIAIGDLGAARVELAALFETAGRMRQPFALHVAEQYAAAIALCDGRLHEAEAAAERSREWSRLLAGRDPSSVYGIQMFGIRREQGRLAELAPAVRSLAVSDRAAAWRPGLAALMAELGMVREARAELDRIRAEGLDTLRPSLWLASLTYLADVCAIAGDAEMAKLVYAELLPHSGSSVMIGHAVACYGAADRYLGMLAAVAGDRDRAALHFEAALARDREAGASTWVAHTACEYGRLLREGGRPDDATRAAELLAEAADLARRIGMRSLLERIHPPGGPVETPAGLSPREVEILRLVARGLSNRDVGRALSISEHTAANHIRSILRKTGAANRTEAAAYAHANGLLDAG
jgi:DNA-binding CsgD family transcriptional regulator